MKGSTTKCSAKGCPQPQVSSPSSGPDHPALAGGMMPAPKLRGITDRPRVPVDRCVQDQQARVCSATAPPTAVPSLICQVVTVGVAACVAACRPSEELRPGRSTCLHDLPTCALAHRSAMAADSSSTSGSYCQISPQSV